VRNGNGWGKGGKGKGRGGRAKGGREEKGRVYCLGKLKILPTSLDAGAGSPQTV